VDDIRRFPGADGSRPALPHRAKSERASISATRYRTGRAPARTLTAPETAASRRQSSRLPLVSAGARHSSNAAVSGAYRETLARVGTR
jgi:hypothetical protein